MKAGRICDVLIIGAGASGSLAALVLAEAGLDVVCLEQGSWVKPEDYAHLHADWSWQRRTNWNPDVNKRVHPDDYPVISDSSQILMWNGVGGSTNAYGGIWPRYRPSDFRKGTEHGLQPDWPITYEDLAPFYEQADRLVGVCGLAGDPAMPTRDPCPTRPMPPSKVSKLLADAFDRLEWHWWPVEAAAISENYDNRPACNGCGACNGCPRGSMCMYSTVVWPRAIKHGAELIINARVLKIERGRDNNATGALYVDRHTGHQHFQKARIVVLAANGVGTPRLLLTSDNLANQSDQVGRNLLHHTLVAGEIWVDEPVDGHTGYLASLISREFAETDVTRGFVNGFNFNCITSAASAGETAAGWFSANRAPWGRDHHKWFERHFGHGFGVFAIGDDLPNPENRVTLDPEKSDSDGIPAAVTRYVPGENDKRMMNYMLDRIEDIAKAAGAFEYQLQDYRNSDGVYCTPAWHMIGTCRMGADPETSVVNKWAQCWDVPNMFIVDGSILTTGGVVNPTPTVSALALRTAAYIRDNFRNLDGA